MKSQKGSRDSIASKSRENAGTKKQSPVSVSSNKKPKENVGSPKNQSRGSLGSGNKSNESVKHEEAQPRMSVGSKKTSYSVDNEKKQSHESVGSAKKHSHDSIGSAKKLSNESVDSTKKTSHESVGSAKRQSHESVGSAKKQSHDSLGFAKKPSHESIGLAKKQSHDSLGSGKQPSLESISPAKKQSHSSLDYAKQPSYESVGSKTEQSHENVSSAKKPSQESIRSAKKPSQESVGSAKKPSYESISSAKKLWHGSVDSVKKPDEHTVSEKKQSRKSIHSKMKRSGESLRSVNKSHKSVNIEKEKYHTIGSSKRPPGESLKSDKKQSAESVSSDSKPASSTKTEVSVTPARSTNREDKNPFAQIATLPTDAPESGKDNLSMPNPPIVQGAGLRSEVTGPSWAAYIRERELQRRQYLAAEHERFIRTAIYFSDYKVENMIPRALRSQPYLESEQARLSRSNISFNEYGVEKTVSKSGVPSTSQFGESASAIRAPQDDSSSKFDLKGADPDDSATKDQTADGVPILEGKNSKAALAEIQNGSSPSEASTTDHCWAAYLRERAAMSWQYLKPDEEKKIIVKEDFYNMDQAENELLKTKPTSFIIIGKPGSGKSTLASLLSKWWRCILINAEDLVEEMMVGNSNVGEAMLSQLESGEAVTDRLIFTVISERLKTDDVHHYGYVLDGIPCISEKVMCHLDQLKLILESSLQPTVIIHLKIPDDDVIARNTSLRFDLTKGRQYSYFYYTDKPKPPKRPKPVKHKELSDEEEEEEEEEAVVEEVLQEETLIGEDDEQEEEELMEEGEEILEEQLDLEEEVGEGEEKMKEKLKKRKKRKKRKKGNLLAPCPQALRDQLLKAPEADQSTVLYKLEAYKSRLMLLLEDYMTYHDPELLIELDATLDPRVLFESLKYRLAVLPVTRALTPIRLLEDGEPPALTPEDDPDLITQTLARCNPVCMRYKWTPSDFGTFCPVSMKDGKITRGDPAFSVGFLDHFYVMSNASAMSRFIQSPRKYLVAPQPPCRVIVCGPPGSGRSTLAAQIASAFTATVIDVAKIGQNMLKSKQEKIRNEWREEKRQALIEATADKQRIDEEEVEQLNNEEEEDDRIQKEEEGRNEVAKTRADKELRTDEDRAEDEEREEDTYVGQLELSDQQKNDEKEQDSNNAEDEEAKQTESKAKEEYENISDLKTTQENKYESMSVNEQKENVGTSNQAEIQQEDTGSDKQVSSMTGEQVEKPTSRQTLSVESTRNANIKPGQKSAENQAKEIIPSEGSAVSSRAGSRNSATSQRPEEPEVEADLLAYNAELDVLTRDVEMEPDDWYEALQRHIKLFEEERKAAAENAGESGLSYGGWVLDNMPADHSLWEILTHEKFEYDDVVCIWDESDDFIYLMHNFYMDNINRDRGESSNELEKEPDGDEERRKTEEEEQQRLERELAEAQQQQQAAVAQQMAQMAQLMDEQNMDTDAIQTPEPADKNPETPKAEETDEQPGTPADDTSQVTSIGIASDNEQQPAAAAAADQMVSDTPTAAVIANVESVSGDDTGAAALPRPPIPPASALMSEYKTQLDNFAAEWSRIRYVLDPHNNPEPIIVPLDKYVRRGTNLLKTVTTEMNKNFKQRAHELNGPDDIENEFGDVNEEVEEYDENADDQEEMEEKDEESEEDEEAKSDMKVLYGETGKFCPVMYKNMNILQPGSEDFAVSYRGQLYLTSSPEAIQAVVSDPDKYLPRNECPEPPPLRLILLGPYGSGKSSRGQFLAEKTGVFFIDFMERLQEIIRVLGAPRVGERNLVEVAGEDGIYEDITQVRQETSMTRLEFEEQFRERAQERAASTGLELEDSASPQPAPGVDAQDDTAAPDKPDSDVGDEEELEHKAYQNDWADWQLEIDAFLSGDVQNLTTQTLDRIVKEWWTEEPFKSTGFILEGFPTTVEDMTYMIENQLFVDAFVAINIEPEQAVDRVIKGKMDEWQQRMSLFTDELKKAREEQTLERQREMDVRRKELENEKEERTKRHEEYLKRTAEETAAEEESMNEDEPPEGSDTMLTEELDEEEEEAVDIDQLITDEFPDMEEPELHWETKEEANDRISDMIRQWYDEDEANIGAVKDLAYEARIPVVEVDGTRKGHIVDYMLSRAVDKYTEERSTLMQRAFPIGVNMAAVLLDTGYRQLSKFGKQCPVTLLERGMMMPPYNPSQRRPYPVVFRRYIYYCVDSAAQAKFVRAPMKYIRQKAPLYLIPSRLAVIGPPKSGKTSVCRGLSKRYGVQRISAGEAVRPLLERWPPLQLGERIKQLLQQGEAVPEPLVVEAVRLAVLSVPAQVHGYVLDGLPLSEWQAQALSDAGVLPYLVLELQPAVSTTVRRARRQENWYREEQVHLQQASTKRRPPADEPRLETACAHCVRLAIWRQVSETVGSYYQRVHGNLVPVPADGCLWHVEDQTRHALETRLKDIHQYRECIATGKPAPVKGMCITPAEFSIRLGPYKHYCPVCWKEGKLCDMSEDPSLAFAVELERQFYRACSEEHMQRLLSGGAEYLPPRSDPLPEDLPRRLTSLDTATLLHDQMNLAFGGLCPVTYADGGRCYENLVRGKDELGVGYYQQVYLFASEEARQRFMCEPGRFFEEQLPQKLPPAVPSEPLDVARLPLAGYVEQMLACPLVRVMTETGMLRPKHPRLNITASALVHLGLQLKSRAAADCRRKKSQQLLLNFTEECSLLDKVAKQLKTTLSDPRKLPEEERQDMNLLTELVHKSLQDIIGNPVMEIF